MTIPVQLRPTPPPPTYLLDDPAEVIDVQPIDLPVEVNR